MHHCLCIQEILRVIADTHGLRHSDRIAMALTCHAFYDPAMDVVWKELPGLGRLIRCLPPQFWEIIDSEDVTCIVMEDLPEPSEEDWNRFRHHARRVRSIVIPADFDSSTPDHIDLSCWERLLGEFSDPGRRMLPNLKTLHWRDDDHLSLNNFKLVMQSSVTSLQFKNDHSPDPGMIPVLDMLRNDVTFSDLKVFAVGKHEDVRAGDHFYTPTFLKALSLALHSTSHLTHLHVDASISMDALSHLATLTSLKSLRFIMQRIEYRSVPTSTTRFSSLSSLVITTSPFEMDPLISFLQMINPSRLLELSICFEGFYGEFGSFGIRAVVQPTANNLHLLFTALSRFETLRSLTVEGSVFVARSSSNSAEFVVDINAFAPLFRLKGMRVCHLADTFLNLTPHFLERLAETWKDVEDLDLGSYHPHEETCLVAVEDLLPLAMHCPKLDILKIRVSHSRKTHSGSLPIPRLPVASPSNLRVLHVCSYHIHRWDVEPIAEFLAYTFPRVEVVGYEVHAWRVYDRPRSRSPEVDFGKLNSLIREIVWKRQQEQLRSARQRASYVMPDFENYY